MPPARCSRQRPPRTLDEATRRADELRTALSVRGVHPDVLRFCRAELVADNYFHAVLEAAKSIFDKLVGNNGAVYTKWDATPLWAGPTALTAAGAAPVAGHLSAANFNNRSLNGAIWHRGVNQ